MEPIQTQHHPCLQKNAPHTPTLPPHAVCTLSFQIAPAFSIPRLNSEQIAIISRYILSLPLLRNILLFLRRRIVVHLSLSLSLSLPSDKTLAKYCALLLLLLRGGPLRTLSSIFYPRLTTTEMTVGRASSIFSFFFFFSGGGDVIDGRGEGGRHRKNLLMLQLL